MPKLVLFKEFGDFLFSFRARKLVLLVLLGASAVFGPFYWLMPALARSWFFLVYIILVMAGVVTHTMFFMQTTESTVRTLLHGLRHKPEPFSSPEILGLAKRMGLLGKVKICKTTNPWFKGAYANPLTSHVNIQESWVTSYPKSEIIAVLAHEFTHLTSHKRFVFELIIATVAGYALSFALTVFTQLILSTNLLLIVSYTFQASLALLLISFVSWRNEYRADMGGAKVTGPEGLISVFETELANGGRNHGSETHPPLSKRIQRLRSLLEKAPVDSS